MTRTGRLTLIALLPILFVFSGCATPTKPLTPDVAGQIHKIAVLEVPGEDQYGVTNLYLEGVAFGGLVNLSHTKEFTLALRQRDVSIRRAFEDDLVHALIAAGFEVERVEATRNAGKVSSHAKTTADALLNFVIGGGYVSHGPDDYIPTVSVTAELMENKTGQQSRIYLDRYFYGYKPAMLTAIEIAAPTGYSYGSYDKLLQSNVEAGEGLLKGAAMISERLANDISFRKR
jgi:hypothetical protein